MNKNEDFDYVNGLKGIHQLVVKKRTYRENH